MDYYHYKAEDFAADDDFKTWVLTPDRESDRFWEEFLREYPEKYYPVQEARRLVSGLQRLPGRTGIDDQAEKVWQRIESTVHKRNVFQSRWARSLSAAMILLGCGLGWWWKSSLRDERVPGILSKRSGMSSDWEEAINNTSETMRIKLADGSKVLLEKSSVLRHRTGFNDSIRVLYLKGAAFFEVTKDANRPFLVHANGLVTKVLGTSFSIDARDNAPNVTVSVKTGRVSVYSDKKTPQSDPEVEGIVLTPNQKAVFKRNGETLSKTLVEKPEELPLIAPVSFVFESAPAKEVFQALARVYGIEVLYDEDLLKDCFLTVDLTNEDLYQKLEVICKVLDARYKLIEAQVIIYGAGCS